MSRKHYQAIPDGVLWFPATDEFRATDDAHEKAANPEILKWSGEVELIPAIGDTIRVRFNRIGFARVTGYYSDDGWFGISVSIEVLRDWWLKQNGRDRIAYVFGNEVQLRPLNGWEGARHCALRLKSRIPRGPHYMPVTPEYAYDLVNDGKVIGTTRYQADERAAFDAARDMATRKRYTILTGTRGNRGGAS